MNFINVQVQKNSFHNMNLLK